MTNEPPKPAPSPHFNLQHQERTVKVYTLTEDEIDVMGALDLMGTISLAFLTTFAGSAITFWLTVDVDSNPYATGTIAVLVAATIASAIVFFGSLWTNRGVKKRIKHRSVPDL